MKLPKDINELVTEVLEAMMAVKADPRRRGQAEITINGAGKVINAFKLQMEYAVNRGEMPDIPFMGPTSGEQIGPSHKSLKAKVRELER